MHILQANSAVIISTANSTDRALWPWRAQWSVAGLIMRQL